MLLAAGFTLGRPSSKRRDPLIRPGAAAAAPEPPAAPIPAARPHDGAAWKTGVWAPDEMQLVLAPGADLPEAGVFARSAGEVGLRIPPAPDRAAFAALAREMRKRPGVKEARPVFYATPEAREKRTLEARLILTRQVAATLPEGVSPEAAAARHGARVLSKLEYLERTWLFEAAGPFDALDVASALREREGAAFAAPQFARVQSRRVGARRLTPDDTLFPQQWSLLNTGQGGGTAGEDIRVVAAWDTVLGDGVVIGIVDDGLDGVHEDLAANYAAALGIDINDGDADPSPGGTFDRHGTACAGLAAARGNNGLGISGSAPRATLAAIRLIAAPTTDAQEAQAMAHENAAIHVKSNSWGPSDVDPELRPLGALMQAAVLDGATNGRGGRGVVYLWAGGNGNQDFDDSNRDAYANQRHVIAVGALTRQGVQAAYSEPGANLLICAPGGEADLTTTDLTGAPGASPGNYRTAFSGTSASCPIAAGVVALLLDRTPDLKARDVMHILVRTARTNHAADADWTDNAAGFSVNHKYGHGAVDAAAAVDLAGRWALAGPVVSRAASSAALSTPIEDFPGATLTHPLEITGTPLRVEHVEIDFNATHQYRGDIEVTLVAPSGTRSVMTPGRPTDDDAAVGFNNWRMMSVRHWGEEAVGTWTLEVRDVDSGLTGTFTGWALRVYGTAVDASAPVAGVVNDGPGPDVDARSSTGTVEANWSGFSDPESGLVFAWAIGTTAGGEEIAPFAEVGAATSASLSGLSLVAGTPYFVTVRATNFDGLSTTASSDGFMIDIQPPDPPTINVTPLSSATGIFTLSWTAPADPGGSGVASYTVRRSKDGGPFSDFASGITGLTFDADVGAEGGGGYTFMVRAVDAAGNPGALSTPAGCSYDPTPPAVTITPPGAAASPLSLGGTASDNGAVAAVSWVNAATGQGGAAGGTTANWTASVPLAPGDNAITVFGWDGVGNVGTATIVVAFVPSDVLPPSLTISVPTSGDTFASGTTPLTLSGGAFDANLTAIEWENLTTGTRGTAAPAGFWTTSVPLLAGINVIVVTARDAAGNATTDTLTVSFAPAADLILPAVDIDDPTTSPAFPAGTSPLGLGGTATDNAALALVRWSNAATGGAGAASGQALWTASIALAPGSNAITVTAVDSSGNEATDVLTVTFTPGGGDAIPPAVTILSPAPGFTTSLGSAVLSGLASDDAGALEVVWFNAANGASGSARGVGAWSAVVPLETGANAITVTVYDAQGNSREDTRTVTLAPVASGGGGGRCGATGFELLLLAPLLRRGGRGSSTPSPPRSRRHGLRRPGRRCRGRAG